MRKGITPIIAIIVLLLITVALAGAAWSYLSTYMTGLTAQSIELRDYFCVGGNDAIIIIANTGTTAFDTADIAIINTSSGDDIADDGVWTPTTIPTNEISTWKSAPADNACAGGCTLRIVGGTARAQVARIFC